MPNLLLEESYESKKPLILIHTNNKRLQDLFYKEFSKKLSILFVSDSPPDHEDTSTYHIKSSDVNLIPHLDEEIAYAILIFEDLKDKDGIEHFITKFKSDNTKAAVLIPASAYLNFIDVLLSFRNIPHVIPALYGQVLENMTSDNELMKIIRKALLKEKIEIKGNDLLPVFPISERDLLVGIKQLLFANKSKALYYLFYKQPETILSAVHTLAQIEPELEFTMDHEHPAERFEERSVMNQNLTDKLQLRISYLDRHLKGFIYSIEHLAGIEPQKPKIYAKTEKRRLTLPKLNFLKFTPSVSLALFSSLMLFLLINIVFGIVGILFLRGSIQAFEKNDFHAAKEKGIIAKNALSVPMPVLSITESAMSYIPFMNNAYKTLHLVTSTADLTLVSAGLIDKLDETDEGITREDFDKILLDAKYLFHAGSRILLIENNRTISSLLKPETTKTLSLMTIMPALMGYDAKKEYLLLFMNNAELRPTGGFIGSVGRLVVENGKVLEFTIQDVYDHDGQLTRHIEPHYIIRRNLQPHLYLRDSNFDLDFQRSASLSAMIYNLESKNTPDGVVAVDFNLVKKILEITGPIKLSAYDKTIDSENSLDFLQNTIEENFFPGSTQKKDILNDLFKNITIKLEQNPEYLVSIGLALPQLLEEKHILLAYQKPHIQSLLSALNFGGHIPMTNKDDENTIYDILGFNEANIGVNKVNKDLSKSIFYEADLTSRLSKAKISFRNSSKTDDYKTYLRLIAPKNSVLLNLKINGKVVETIDAIIDPRIYEAPNFSPDKSVYEVDSTNDYDKKIFGTVVEVRRGEIKSVEFEYTNPLLFLNDGKNEYDLYVIKQPGTDKTQSLFSVLFPDDFIAKGDSINSFGNGNIKIENELKTDLDYKVFFTKE